MKDDMTGKTKYWPAAQLQDGIIEAAAVLAEGGIIAFPTETVYGLGGDARNTKAVEHIFTAKGRPSDNPLIVHLADKGAVLKLVREVNEIEEMLMDAFWPGPLTFVLPVRDGAVSPLVTAGLDTVAIRVPAHEMARKLIEQSGCPLAAPSANRSGRPSPTQASHVMEDLAGRIDGVLDGGATGVGLESTVIRVLGEQVHILRPGGITREQLIDAVGSKVKVISPEEQAKVTQELGAQENDGQESGTEAHSSQALGLNGFVESSTTRDTLTLVDGVQVSAVSGLVQAPRSPGVKYTHYAPRGEMLLVTGQADRMIAVVQRKLAEARQERRQVGVLACTEHVCHYEGEHIFDCGSLNQPELAAQSLYAFLRQCDERGLDFIIAEGYPEQGIGAALMNRLRKASGGHEIIV